MNSSQFTGRMKDVEMPVKVDLVAGLRLFMVNLGIFCMR